MCFLKKEDGTTWQFHLIQNEDNEEVEKNPVMSCLWLSVLAKTTQKILLQTHERSFSRSSGLVFMYMQLT